LREKSSEPNTRIDARGARPANESRAKTSITPSGNWSQRRSLPKAKSSTSFSAAGLKQPDLSILSDQLLAEVRGLKYKNVAAELLAKLLGDEIKLREYEQTHFILTA
jgi:hypothetical protein